MDRVARVIDRLGAVIDLVAAVIFLAIVVRVWQHIDGLLKLVEVE